MSCRGIFLSFSTLCCCSPYHSDTECGQIFHSFRPPSNVILKLGGLLRWKTRLVNDAGISLPLTEVMKIARLTSPLLDVAPRSLSRLRHGRSNAYLSLLNLCTLSFALALTLFLILSPHVPYCFSPRESALVFADHLRFHFSVSKPKALRCRSRGDLAELRRAMCPEKPHSSFFSPFSPINF